MTGVQTCALPICYAYARREKSTEGKVRPVERGIKWMDAMSVDYSCLFPTSMLNVGLHPQLDMEVDLCWAYNRWLTEKALPESNGRIYSMCGLPLSDLEASLRQVEAFGHRKGVTGFMVTTVRTLPVHHDSYMKLYRAIEERGIDRKSTRLNSSHIPLSRMPSSA